MDLFASSWKRINKEELKGRTFMTLYIKQKLFSLGDKYEILDEYQNPVYFAKGKLFTVGNKIQLCDTQEREVLFLKQRLMKLLPVFEICQGDNLFATVKREFTFFKKKITVESSHGVFVIDGDFWNHEYAITCDGKLFGTVSKEWLTWGDVYALNINSNEFADFFVALVLAIDCILEGEKYNG